MNDYNKTFSWQSNPFTFKILPELFTGYSNEFKTLTNGLKNGSKFSLLSGPTGSGKTTLLMHLLDSLDSRSTIIFLPKPPQDPKDFIEIFESKLKKNFFEKIKRGKSNLYNLKDYVNKKLKNRKCVVLIDECHEAPLSTLEWIRTLADQIDNLSVVFAGLPVFDNILKDNLETLRRRINTKVELGNLTKSETKDLIKKRIEHAGGEDVKPFTMNSIELLYEKTGGFPRDVIKLCNDVVERALENNISLIDSDFISEEKAIQRTSINTVAEMPKRQKDIIHILSKYGELTPTEVASKIDLKGYGNKNNAMRSVNNLLRRLMSNKLVTRKKHGKAYKYALASKIQTVLVKA